MIINILFGDILKKQFVVFELRLNNFNFFEDVH
jgi:hypothetical protein